MSKDTESISDYYSENEENLLSVEDEEEFEDEEEQDEEKEEKEEEKDDLMINININEKKMLNELKGENRITKNTMTKYEFVRILGTRIKQLSLGASPLIKDTKNTSYHDIALEELRVGMTPIIVRRVLPNNTIEHWKVKELQIDHLFN